MKFTLVTLTTVLALSGVGEGYKWECAIGSGGNNQNLQTAVNDFDKLFGTRVLKAAPNQCYTSLCRGYYFSFCNRAGVTQTEKSGQRNQAKRKTLPHGKGSNCRIAGLDNAVNYARHVYGFGKISDMKSHQSKPVLGTHKNDLRKC
ncbi:hypothetical protein NLU13_0312 [Sarocladium strictum]|uniref:Uncharacterized protein n=1 Tax=Sarocladium strictum TaxID=5046 RepID=A0AA39GPL5_SARSR|nr:hypothetical protein NLU13_0312 [Sarocladium strictum]